MELTQFAKIKKVPTIKEELHEGLKTIAMSNFTNALEAATEIIDNSIDERDPSSKPLKLIIKITPNHMMFLDSNTFGMGHKELSDFLRWGFSPKRYRTDAIGKYGAGGKGAIGYLGVGCKIRTKRKGQDVEWEIDEPNWRDPSKKELLPEARKSDVKEDIGFTQIDIRGVDRKINKNQLSEMISHYYRPLLKSGELEVRIGTSTTTKKVQAFEPPLDEKFEIQNVDVETKSGKIHGWIARLAPKSHLRGGIRSYYRGRLISKDYKKAQEFYGHPDPQSLASLNFLFGEMHLDFVPIQPNKTDFDRQSKEWEEVFKTMNKILTPHIEQLRTRREELEVTEEDLSDLPEVRNLVFKARENVMKEEVIRGSIPAVGELQGRKPTTTYDAEKDQPQKQPTQNGPRAYTPSTPPPYNPVGRLKRTYGEMKFDVRTGDGLTRGAIIEEGGEKILIIYKKYPEYLARNGDFIHKAETAVLQLEKPEEENEVVRVDSYLDKVDRVMAEVIRLYELGKRRGRKTLEKMTDFIQKLESIT